MATLLGRKPPNAIEADALRHRNALRYAKGASSDLVAHRCRCGAWHVGHSQERLRKRISRALGGPHHWEPGRHRGKVRH